MRKRLLIFLLILIEANMQRTILTLIAILVIGILPIASYGHGGRVAADG